MANEEDLYFVDLCSISRVCSLVLLRHTNNLSLITVEGECQL